MMKENPVIKPLKSIPLICFEKKRAIEKMTEYLNKAGFAVVKRNELQNDYKFALERIRTWVCNDARTFKDPVGLLENIDDYVNKVLKREPKLKACPVCGKGNIATGTTESLYGDIIHHVYCNDCRITISKRDKDEAIEAWNALPRKGE